MRSYNYSMGFKVDGTPLPDPAGFTGATSALDTSAERDMTGLLHRNMVAQKVPTDFTYSNIDWPMCQMILQAVRPAKFAFTFPDPNIGELRTGDFYAGDRRWEVVWFPEGEQPQGWYVNLTFSVIEY